MRNSVLLEIIYGDYPLHRISGYITDEDMARQMCQGDGTIHEDDGIVYVYNVKFDHKTHVNEDGEEYNTIENVRVYTPYDPRTEYHFITKTCLQKIYPLDYDGDALFVNNCVEVYSDNPELRGYHRYYTAHGIHNVTNEYLQPMKESFFDRASFSKAFSNIIASNFNVLEKLEDVISGFYTVEDFKIWTEEEEVYILHVPSGTMIGWYKFYHYGRANFCNRPEMTIDDLIDFLWLLRNQLLEEADEPDEETEYHPQVKVTETDHSAYEPTETDVEQAMRRIMINSVYGAGIGFPSLEDITRSMEHVWNVVKQWASDKYNLSETYDVKCTVTNSHGKYYVAWLIRHYDFIQIMADNGEEIMIGYNRAEYSYANQYGRQTCVEDPDEQIRFDNQIIDRFYHDFFTHGPVRKEYDFYKKMSWEEDEHAENGDN